MHKSTEISAGYTGSYASGVGPWLGRLGRVADCSSSVGDVLRAPVPRQEFVNALGGLIRQAGQHVGEPSLWIDVGEISSGDEAADRGLTPAALMGAGQRPDSSP